MLRLTRPAIVSAIEDLVDTYIKAVLIAALLGSVACKSGGGGGPTGPGLLQTRTLSLSGDLAFGAIPVGTLATREITLTATGTETVQINSVSAPTGFGAFVTSFPVFTFLQEKIPVTFSPTAAQSFGGALSISSNATNAVQISMSGSGTVAAGHTARVFSGDLSGGDTHCFVGSFNFDQGPCKVFEFTASGSGRVDAVLNYNGESALLGMDLYDPVKQTTIARGELSFDPGWGVGEHRTLNTNLPPGRYQFQVYVISTSKITAFQLIAQTPQ